jgi:Ca2+/Na+ antiporter
MKIRTALLIAGTMLAFSAALVFADKAGYIGDETAKRAVQVAIGLILVYFANLAPKTLEPLADSCDPSRVRALQRFSGWALVIGGLGYSLAWLVVPIDAAAIVSMAILGTCLLLVVARCAWTLKSRGQDQSSA